MSREGKKSELESPFLSKNLKLSNYYFQQDRETPKNQINSLQLSFPNISNDDKKSIRFSPTNDEKQSNLDSSDAGLLNIFQSSD